VGKEGIKVTGWYGAHYTGKKYTIIPQFWYHETACSNGCLAAHFNELSFDWNKDSSVSYNLQWGAAVNSNNVFSVSKGLKLWNFFVDS
jgi:hypothetical protein